MSTWSLVFATEPTEPNAQPQTNVVAGTLKDLRDAVVNGADVKVLYRPTPNQWRAVTCSVVLVKGSASRTQVVAEGALPLALNSPLGDGFGTESFAFDSGGFVAHSRFDSVAGGHGQAGGAFFAAPLRWYVRDYEVPFWFARLDKLPRISKEP